MGSLFKSQNGSIWTANQYQDLKFKLYKAQFTSPTGTAFFYNPTLDESNGYVQRLGNNPLTTLPKTLTVGITTTTNASLIANLSKGRKVVDGTKNYVYGYVVGTGSSVSSVGITTGGSNYVTDTSVNTYNITGSGSGLVLNITATSGTITGISTVNPGNGYAVGDVVGIVTSSVSSNTGKDARITIGAIGSSLDTLYLSNVQGESFTVGAGLSYYNDSNALVSLASTFIRSSSSSANQYSGNFMRVDHFDHGMYGNTNKLAIKDVESSTAPTTLSATLTSQQVSTISIGDTSNFGTFEGVAVSATNIGYVKIENEIIAYNSVGNGTLTIAASGRGIDSTIVIPHDINSLVYKYELNGISLRRINTTHDISDLQIGLDAYYLEIDRSSTTGLNRSTDGSAANMPQLSFTSEANLGGSKVLATENIQYSSIVPHYDIITPGSSTSATASIRTTSGTSVGGNETSFLDNGFEPIQLNSLNPLRSVRLVCSKQNETQYLGNLPRNKSFTTGITLNTSDSNLSPIIYLNTAFTEFISSRLNNPISDYAADNKVNSILNDPHAAVYVSNTVNLAQPATTLKVILSAYRHSSADFRVLYSLIRPDSSEVDQSFELFPGYNNLTYTTADGYRVLDKSKNSGLPDTFVSSSLDNQFLEYQFTADNLDLFTGYTIKIVMSGTNQAYPPRISELRTLAVR
jgi:hypothetical protein